MEAFTKTVVARNFEKLKRLVNPLCSLQAAGNKPTSKQPVNFSTFLNLGNFLCINATVGNYTGSIYLERSNHGPVKYI